MCMGIITLCFSFIIVAVQGPAQLPHPPVTSTPEEVNLNTTISITDSNHTPIGLMLPSNHHPPIKYSSTDISTGSSSSSYIMKCKGVTRLDGENMEKAGNDKKVLVQKQCKN